MPAQGSNLSFGNTLVMWKRVMRKWFGDPTGPERRNPSRYSDALTADDGTTHPRQCVLLTKAGVPSNNTAADAPTGKYDLIWDETNKDLYLCTAYTSTTSFTLSKIID